MVFKSQRIGGFVLISHHNPVPKQLIQFIRNWLFISTVNIIDHFAEIHPRMGADAIHNYYRW
jgi:hypothetical protein